MVYQLKKDQLQVAVFEDRESLGNAAAIMFGDKVSELLKQKEYINIIFAAAPSQNEFLAAIANDTVIEWPRINAFHMDEYLGLPPGASQSFGSFLSSKLFSLMPFKSVNYINGNAADINEECIRYTKLVNEFPPDIVCMGIGENTHIAFNDPHKADFNDTETIKIVSLDEICRQQQVNDGCFNTIDDVPRNALTLTIPALMQAPYIYCIVPGKTKAAAVLHTLEEELSAECPSTILRSHPGATLFTDTDSFSMINY